MRAILSKELNNKNCRIYYARHKEERKQKILERQRRIRDQVQDYKLSVGCAVCGYNKCARALQFHHTADDKENCVARMTGSGNSFEKILVEIEKCICVCANCHAEIHDTILKSADGTDRN